MIGRGWIVVAAVMVALAAAACADSGGDAEVALLDPGTGPGTGPGPGPDAGTSCNPTDAADPCPGQLARLEDDGTYTCFTPECWFDGECPPGEVCDPLTGACGPPPACVTSLDCEPGERCEDGACVPDTCDEHEDCPWGVCLNGICAPQPTCAADADCPAGWECYDPAIGAGVCVPIVQTCVDCAPPFICDVHTSTCKPVEVGCDAACETGVCIDGACAFCEADTDCAAGSHCDGGYCVETPQPCTQCTDAFCRLACEIVEEPAPPAMPRTSSADEPAPPPPSLDGWAANNNPNAFSGTLEVIVLPPPDHLDWTTPIKLMTSAAAAAVRGERNVVDGKAKLAHFIGHLHVKMDCTNGMNQALRIPLTGATSGGKQLAVIWHNARAALGAMGVLFYPFPPKLDEGNQLVKDDLDARAQHPGMMSIIRLPIDDWQCRDLALYYDKYKKNLAQTKYDSQARPRRFEGAGCTAFGTVFIEKTRLVPRSKMVDNWAQQVEVGHSVIGKPSKVLAALDSTAYPYGSNLVAWIGGAWKAWPRGQSIASSDPVVLTNLDRWVNGTEVATPLTLFDTEPMTNYINAVHAGADAAMWTPSVEHNGNVKVITRKRDCNEVLPRNPDADDLRRDN